MVLTGSNGSRYLFGVQLSQVTQNHGKCLCVVLMDPEVDGFQAAHVQQQLGLLQSHGTAQNQNFTC